MKKKIWLFILLVFCIHSSAQNITVLDCKTNQPIPFATAIFIINGAETSAMYADENGILRLPENVVYDVLHLSSLGYENIFVSKHDIMPEIYMTNKPVKLAEVEINFTRRLKDTILGEYNIKKGRKMQLGVQNQMAVFFENPFNDEVPLKELCLKVHKVKYKTALRIHFFCRRNYVQILYIENDPDKKYVPHDSFIPGDEITGQEIITYLMPGDKELKLDLTGYNITLPYDGVFAGIECLGYLDESGEPVTIDNKNFTQLEYHQTPLDNYCEKIKLYSGFWSNVNRRAKADTFMMGVTLDKDSYQAPTMGLVVSK